MEGGPRWAWIGWQDTWRHLPLGRAVVPGVMTHEPDSTQTFQTLQDDRTVKTILCAEEAHAQLSRMAQKFLAIAESFNSFDETFDEFSSPFL